jgi:geranylgeranyl diphosphate synthase type II
MPFMPPLCLPLPPATRIDRPRLSRPTDASRDGRPLPATIWDDLAPRARAVDCALARLVAALPPAVPDRLRDAIGYSLLAPGKRLRPLLVVLAAEAVGGSADAAMSAGCAVEMVHTYSLIHDDLPAMDDDDLRRGRPTCHKQFDEATAILAGDALLTQAFRLLAESYPADVAAVSVAELAAGAGAAGMVGGQMLDLAAEAETPGAGPAAVARLETIHRLKTGALFRAAVRIGCVTARRNDPETLGHLNDYADAFGLAFQVTDDLLDVEGTAEATGKRVGKDAALGKWTYPGLLGVAESRARAADLGRRAVAAARAFGEPGLPLARLAEFVVQRKR